MVMIFALCRKVTQNNLGRWNIIILSKITQNKFRIKTKNNFTKTCVENEGKGRELTEILS